MPMTTATLDTALKPAWGMTAVSFFPLVGLEEVMVDWHKEDCPLPHQFDEFCQKEKAGPEWSAYVLTTSPYHFKESQQVV